MKSRTSDRQPYVTLGYEREGSVKKNTKPRVEDEEEEVPIKGQGEQMVTSDNWQLFVHDRRHNHEIAVYNHGHAQAARLTEEQLKQTEQFRKSHVPPRSEQKIYNVVAKIKKNMMQGRNTMEEVLCLSAERGDTIFYRKSEDSNVLVILSLYILH
ncbi:hypothetical protein M9H77_21851 [Catharanthus roseus]|uniref:Uncharacterized protein n=1 Tax=Catharanthus roseus TaxID=4058 RepID=A0ACC0ASW5_CATRO|nr:hypothetical protein M9H77_21851 [Catharanthus roseus]